MATSAVGTSSLQFLTPQAAHQQQRPSLRHTTGAYPPVRHHLRRTQAPCSTASISLDSYQFGGGRQAVLSRRSCSGGVGVHASRREATGAGSGSTGEQRATSSFANAVFLAASTCGLGLATSLLLPGSALASEGAVPLELFRSFLDSIEAMGPLGAVAFIATISVAEMIPLFPTQPFSLAAGLLFGGMKGAGLVLAGNVTAATSAFLLARGVGRTLAERVIKHEMAEAGEAEAAKGKSMLGNVERAIENGSPTAQFVSVLLLRLTPVVPFSASNYLLGLTPLPFLPFFSATLMGMTPWAILFASLGQAGRTLLDGGEDLGKVLADLGEKAGGYTQTALLLGAGILVAAAAVWGVRKLIAGPVRAKEGRIQATEKAPVESTTDAKSYVDGN